MNKEILRELFRSDLEYFYDATPKRSWKL